jgi:hypothetical protein
MKEYKIKGRTYLFVPIPEHAEKFRVDSEREYLVYDVPNFKNWCNDSILGNYGKLQKFIQTHNSDNDYKRGGSKIPAGNYKIIGRTDTLTEEQKVEIVESEVLTGEMYQNGSIKVYKCYTGLNGNVAVFTIENSFNSLLQSLNINTPHLIIEKI